MVTERVSIKAGLVLLPLFLMLESRVCCSGTRANCMAQAVFALCCVQVCSNLVLLIVLLFPARYTHASDVAIVVGFYALAKVLELFDKQVFRATDVW